MNRNQFIASLATLPFIKLESSKDVVKMESKKDYRHIRTKLLRSLIDDYVEKEDYNSFEEIDFDKIIKSNLKFKVDIFKYKEDNIGKVDFWYKIDKKTWCNIEAKFEI